MNSDDDLKQQRLAQARALVDAIEADNDQRAAALIDDIAAGRHESMYEEVGRMTREVHDALMDFASDDRLMRMAEAEMPDARDRLRYVITLTDQAATRTLGIVEQTLPMAERLSERAERLKKELADVGRSEPDNERLQIVIESVSSYLDSVLHNSGGLKSQLNEVMMAQEFQDLSGQLLLRVIDLLELLEDKLVGLLRLSSPAQGEKQQAADLNKGVGPQVPGTQADVVQNQDDVDDLLASLGF